MPLLRRHFKCIQTLSLAKIPPHIAAEVLPPLQKVGLKEPFCPLWLIPQFIP